MKDDKFDNYIKDTFKNEVKDIQPSRDIFEDAWNENKIRKVRFGIKKVVAAAVSCFVIMGGLITFSPEVRANVLTFFGVDSQGNIVEKSPEDLTSVSGNWGRVTDADRPEVEDILGFKLDFPRTSGEYNLAGIVPIIIIEDVKIKDSSEIVDKVFRNENQEDNFKNYRELAETHNTKKSAILVYKLDVNSKEEEGFFVSVSKKKDNESKDEDMKYFDIEGVECGIKDTTGFKYVSKMIDKFSGMSDITKEPELTDVNYIEWTYGDFDYMLDIDKGTSQEDIMNFLKGYINELKER